MPIDIRYLTRLPVDMAHGLKYVTPLVIHVQGRGLNESFQRLNSFMGTIHDSLDNQNQQIPE